MYNNTLGNVFKHISKSIVQMLYKGSKKDAFKCRLKLPKENYSMVY